MRIALIDNDLGLCDLFKELCRQRGLEPLVEASGAVAVNTLLHHRVDLAIIDLGLTDLSGIQLIRQVRRNEKTFGFPSARIIVYTGYDVDSEIWEKIEVMLKRAEIEGVINKSVPLDELLDRYCV